MTLSNCETASLISSIPWDCSWAAALISVDMANIGCKSRRIKETGK